ncbi:MAG: hypothetical protein WCK06_04625 [Actinomycetota bacterium]
MDFLSSAGRTVIAVVVLIIVAVVLLKFAIGIVAGFFALLLYVAIGVVLVAAVIWAVRAL